jgi:hypothetical protein
MSFLRIFKMKNKIPTATNFVVAAGVVVVDAILTQFQYGGCVNKTNLF